MSLSLVACSSNQTAGDDAAGNDASDFKVGVIYINSKNATAIVPAVFSIRNKQDSGLPATLGVNYFLEER